MQEKIDYIKKVIAEWGGFCVTDVDGEEPIFVSGTKDDHWLGECVSNEGLDLTHYIHEQVVGYGDIAYEDMEDNIFNEVYRLVENFEAMELKTEKRCQS